MRFHALARVQFHEMNFNLVVLEMKTKTSDTRLGLREKSLFIVHSAVLLFAFAFTLQHQLEEDSKAVKTKDFVLSQANGEIILTFLALVTFLFEECLRKLIFL